MIGKLDLYRIFNIVSRNKSFSKAAQELYMTQSAVSQAIIKVGEGIRNTAFLSNIKGSNIDK